MTRNTLNQALPIVAAAYGRKFGVPVQVGGDTACTDGQLIRIPQLVDDPQAKTLAWGYLAHEAGHVRHTDFDLWRQGGPDSALTRAVTNILEDVRIEQAMLRDYPGTRQTLDAVVDWMLAEGQLAAPKAEEPPPTLFVNSLLVLARARYRQQAMLEPAAKVAEQRLRQVFPARFVHQLLGLMTEIAGLGSTADALALARRMVALMQQEAQPQQPPKPPQPQQGQAGENAPQDGNGDQGSEGEAPQHGESGVSQDGDGGGSGSSEAPAPAGTEDQQPGGATRGGNGQSQPAEETAFAAPAGPSEDGAVDGRSALAQTLAVGEDELPEDVFAKVAQALGAQSQESPTLLPTLERGSGASRLGQQALQRVKGHSASLSTRLQGLVQSHTQSRRRRVSQGRQLDGRGLHRAAVGDGRLFQRKDQHQAPNTALHLLVDLSGSMAGGDDRLALDAAMALALALEPIRGVSRAVTAFPDRSGGDQQVSQLLAHGERVARRAGAFVEKARGSTPMTGALWFAAADLLSRPEPRKVLLTLTDGVPNDRPSAMRMIAQARRAGLELIGIGISRDVGDVFPTAVRIDQITALKAALFRIAEQLLLTTHH